MNAASQQIVKRTAKDTLTPVELNCGECLQFTLRSGEERTMELISTSAEVLQWDREKVVTYKFSCQIRVDGRDMAIDRFVPTQESFYDPLEIDGLRIWFDAVSDIFEDDGGFLGEKDSGIGIVCKPRKKARFAVNDIKDRICPELLRPWYPETANYIDISRCYRGEDTWMGPYDGRLAHGGLDINMPSGTSLMAPIGFDDHYLFNSLAAGDNNNRWRGIRNWPDGSVWWLQAHHLNEMLVPERGPLPQGSRYAYTAGVLAGEHKHTHFVFRVFEEGQDYFLDPWILFREIFANA